MSFWFQKCRGPRIVETKTQKTHQQWKYHQLYDQLFLVTWVKSTKSENGYWDCLSGKHRMACCPVGLVLKMHFTSRKIKTSEIFFRISFLSFVLFFTRVIYWYHHGKFPTARENLFYILLALIEFRKRERERERVKVYRGKLFSVDIVFCRFCGILKYPAFSTFSTRCCHHQFGCIKGTVEAAKKEKNRKFNCGFFPNRNPSHVLLRREELSGVAIKILKQWRNLIFSSTRKMDFSKNRAKRTSKHAVE